MTFIPYSLLCLASAMSARAIQDDAFEPSFTTSDELLNRPILEDVDAFPLKWKSQLLDKPILKLSASTFYQLWERTCLVSGMREHPRFYSTRVGAGGRLDGKKDTAKRI